MSDLAVVLIVITTAVVVTVISVFPFIKGPF